MLQDGTTSVLTGHPLSARYRTILQGRKILPVYSRMKDFYDIVSRCKNLDMVANPWSGSTVRETPSHGDNRRDWVGENYTVSIHTTLKLRYNI